MSFTHDTSKNKKSSTLLENIALKNKQRKNLLNQTKKHIVNTRANQHNTMNRY